MNRNIDLAKVVARSGMRSGGGIRRQIRDGLERGRAARARKAAASVVEAGPEAYRGGKPTGS